MSQSKNNNKQESPQGIAKMAVSSFKSLVEECSKAMLKDCLLIEAALATDKIVISLDEKVRRYFNQASVTVKNRKVILWINPDKSEDKAITWLQDDAKIEPARLLGHEQK